MTFFLDSYLLKVPPLPPAPTGLMLEVIYETASLIQMNVGSPTPVGDYIVDAGFVGGATASNGNIPDTSGVPHPAPSAVYNTVRFDNTGFSKTLSGLSPGTPYRIRTHSMWYSTSFSFQIKANGVVKATLSFTSPADDNKVKVADFTVNADSSGNILLEWENISIFALVSALENIPNQRVHVSWDPTLFPTLAGYNLRRALDADFTVDVAEFELDDTPSHDDEFSILYNTEFFYQVAARDGAGRLSAYSPAESITVHLKAGDPVVFLGDPVTFLGSPVTYDGG